MALKYASIEYEHREIEFRNKPQTMLLVSPKGTVPVLCVDGRVLDQSVDIMRWALGRADPDDWSRVDESISQPWVQRNDGPFKALLDQYKYPNRFPDLNQKDVLNGAIDLMLDPMYNMLRSSTYLLGNKISWVDVAIFPFIRPFAAVNPRRFEGLPFTSLKKWLNEHLESELFNSIMNKSLDFYIKKLPTEIGKEIFSFIIPISSNINFLVIVLTI
jgi:glutathione S-transferase